MKEKFIKWFESKIDRRSTILALVLVVLMSVAAVLFGIIENPGNQLIVVTFIIALGVALFFAIRGNITFGRWLIPFAAYTIIAQLVFQSGFRGLGTYAFTLVILTAGLFLGEGGGIVIGILSSVTVFVIGYLEVNGIVERYLSADTSVQDVVMIPLFLLVLTVLQYLIVRRLNSSLLKAGEAARVEQAINRELRELQKNLEISVQHLSVEFRQRGEDLEKANRQIQRRAGQFEALAQVAQSISYIRDTQELLPHVASVVSEKYGFYHVGVFLIDENKEYAVLTAANSEGGKRMLERNHRLRVGEEGIVGNVTATGEPRITLDVATDAVYFGNPDLPDTRSEMALPLRSGDKIIGALDVQSTEAGAFTSDDMQTLSLLADQVSLALENARLFENSNRTLTELQLVMRQSTREVWKRLPEQHNLLGFRYNSMGASPLREPIMLSGIDKGMGRGRRVGPTSFVVPIELRGEVIGSLVVQSPTGNEWNEDQQDLIRAVAERVALSAENARLFDETTQRAERERLVSEITSKIRSNNDPQAMIETAIHELRNALGASRVEIIPKVDSGKDFKV